MIKPSSAMPKNERMRRKIAQAAITIKRPMMALMILFRAASKAPLSPPEVIQDKPPIIRLINVQMVATVKRRPTKPEISLLRRLGALAGSLKLGITGFWMGEIDAILLDAYIL